jgi:hypothetical protein
MTEVVYMTPLRIEYLIKDLVDPIQKRYVHKTLYHPDDPVDLKRCKCHYKYAIMDWDKTSRGKQTFYLHCPVRGPEWNAWKISDCVDPCGLWKEYLLDKHQCHWCTRLFPCHFDYQYVAGCMCWYARQGRWYCPWCQPHPNQTNDAKYHAYFKGTDVHHEHCKKSLYEFQKTLVRNPTTNEIEHISQRGDYIKYQRVLCIKRKERQEKREERRRKRHIKSSQKV